MATEAHYIYSYYDPEDRECPENETPQRLDKDHLDQVWEREAPRLNRLKAPAPQFVPATQADGDWASHRSKPLEDSPKDNSSLLGPSLSDWYRSLGRRATVNPPKPVLGFESSMNQPLPRAESSTSKQHEATNKNNWFIMKAIQSEPPLSSSTSTSSLSDMLNRDPPPLPSQGKYKPPVWLEIGPSNKGFGMLQRAGWNEGEALGSDIIRRKPVDAIIPDEDLFTRTDVKGKGKSRQNTGTTHSIRTETRVVEVEGMEEIKELRQVEVVDLTVDSDEDASDSDISPERGTIHQKSSLVKEEHMEQPGAPDILGYERIALLTPIATVLKSDRLGIGLKAKTVGPYKVSKKRVTHNAAALAAHARAAEESRQRRERFGRGKRAFERQYKREEEKRQSMIAYLKSS